MLTTLSFRYPPGRVPPVIAGIRQYLAGWPDPPPEAFIAGVTMSR